MCNVCGVHGVCVYNMFMLCICVVCGKLICVVAWYIFMYEVCGWCVFGIQHMWHCTCSVASVGVMCDLYGTCDVWYMYCMCCSICLYGMLRIVYM